MRAIVTRPGAGRAWQADIPLPQLQNPDDALVRMLRVGVCGTDRHVMDRMQTTPRGLPDGVDYLVLGHEAVGEVVGVGANVHQLRVGDLVVPTVRRGCGECVACAVGQADLCYTGRYRERGIVGLHGFLSQHILERAEYLVRVPEELRQFAPLVESLTTPEKALRRIGNARDHLPDSRIKRGLVTGSGPIALLAVMAFRLRGVDTTVLARQPADGVAADLTRRVGANYVPLAEVDFAEPQKRLGAFDAIIEATGAVELAVGAIGALERNGVLDLVGGPPQYIEVPIHARATGGMVGRNLTILGSVNANGDDWRTAAGDLLMMRRVFPGVVEALITDSFGFDDVEIAFERRPGQIKAVIEVPPE